jgi:hypothetical protein
MYSVSYKINYCRAKQLNYLDGIESVKACIYIQAKWA